LENSKTIFKEFENFINSIHASIETDESTGRWNCGGLDWLINCVIRECK